jgi:hypothetical protein
MARIMSESVSFALSEDFNYELNENGTRSYLEKVMDRLEKKR